MFYPLHDVFYEILQPRTPATPRALNAMSKTLFVGNLSFKVERADVYVLFPVQVIDRHFLYIF